MRGCVEFLSVQNNTANACTPRNKQQRTAVEHVICNATSNDWWGPNTADINRIGSYINSPGTCEETMSALLNRLIISKQSNWRHAYKTFKILETLIQQGNQKVFIECCQKMEVGLFKSLDNFSYIDDCNTDRGVLLRNKVIEFTTLLKELRETAYKPPVRRSTLLVYMNKASL